MTKMTSIKENNISLDHGFRHMHFYERSTNSSSASNILGSKEEKKTWVGFFESDAE